MTQRRTGLTRREFLEGAAFASGAAALMGAFPSLVIAGQAGAPKLGAQFIGKLDGPEIIRDLAKFPKSFKEAPMLDVMQANALLDKVGLTKKDAEGYRLRTDGKGRIRIELMTVGGQFIPFTQVAEMIKQHWQKIGIDADVKEAERGLAFTRTANAEHQIMFWTVSGAENLYLFPRHVLPVDTSECHLGMPFARWYATNGVQGKKPTNPEMLRTFELYRSAAGKREAERVKIAQEIWKIIVEECWVIGTVGLSPAFMGVRIVKNTMGNIPLRQTNAQHARTPNTSHPATFFLRS